MSRSWNISLEAATSSKVLYGISLAMIVAVSFFLCRLFVYLWYFQALIFFVSLLTILCLSLAVSFSVSLYVSLNVPLPLFSYQPRTTTFSCSGMHPYSILGSTSIANSSLAVSIGTQQMVYCLYTRSTSTYR